MTPPHSFVTTLITLMIKHFQMWAIHMNFQMAPSWAFIGTMITLEVAYLEVYAFDMTLHSLSSCCRKVALLTCKIFDTFVNCFEVPPKVLPITCFVVAMLAAQFLVVSNSYVPVNMTLMYSWVFALFTLKPNSLMHWLVTHFTMNWFKMTLQMKQVFSWFAASHFRLKWRFNFYIVWHLRWGWSDCVVVSPCRHINLTWFLFCLSTSLMMDWSSWQQRLKKQSCQMKKIPGARKCSRISQI